MMRNLIIAVAFALLAIVIIEINAVSSLKKFSQLQQYRFKSN